MEDSSVHLQLEEPKGRPDTDCTKVCMIEGIAHCVMVLCCQTCAVVGCHLLWVCVCVRVVWVYAWC